MENEEFELLVRFFKTLADENRLKIVGFLSNNEYRVSELAELLDLKEPTVSHHLARLRELGLVAMRAEANNRFYRLNPERLEKLNAHLFNIDTLNPKANWREQDAAWIDSFAISDEDKKIVKDYVQNKKLRQIPLKDKKLMAVLRWLLTFFEAERRYTEQEVNAIIEQYHEDTAGLRRDLIDCGLMGRERDGSAYWVNPTALR